MWTLPSQWRRPPGGSFPIIRTPPIHWAGLSTRRQVYTSAINLFKEAVKKEPDNALFNYHLGLAYAKTGQAGLAKQQLDRVVKIKPNFPDVDELRRAVAEAKG